MTFLKTAPASGNTRNIVTPASLAGHIDLKVEAHHLHQVRSGARVWRGLRFPPAARLLAVFGRLLGRFDPPANPVR
jgi:hypothetical protein